MGKWKGTLPLPLPRRVISEEQTKAAHDNDAHLVPPRTQVCGLNQTSELLPSAVSLAIPVLSMH